MGMSSTIQGNHATIRVPYEFTGNVIYVLSSEDIDYLTVPPFTKWDPMWKAGRYITDLNIVKPDYRGFHYSVDGTCNGTAIYVSAISDTTGINYIWGLIFSGLKIAGGFSYGIRLQNINDGWAHDMRIEAFIDACEIGVSLENCNCAYLSAIVQPRRALTASDEYVPYAKHGIQLINSTNVDLTGSRVWDWDSNKTLWSSNGEYQHIAMIGDCHGAVLNDFLYYENINTDIRDLIYTDTASNLKKITIINEPFTRWFKPKEGVPYFYDGSKDNQICLSEDLNEHFETSKIKNFTDVLSTATNGADGIVFHDIGYVRQYYYWEDTGELVRDDTANWLGCTGFIPCSNNDTIYTTDLSLATGDDYCRIVLYDSSFNKIAHINRGNILKNNWYSTDYEEIGTGFKLTLQNIDNVAYVVFNFYTECIGASPMIAINEEIEFSYSGFLRDGIKVRAKDVDGLSDYAKTTDVNDALSKKQNNLNFDDTPIKDSENLVKSGGIYSANENILAVANGKCKAYVFDTVPDLDTWLENESNTKDLKTGDVFLIRAVDVPDYWWDGSTNTKQILETTKVNLDTKVDKVPGKGLSTNDYTTAEKNKLANLDPIATTGSYQDLKNMPIISKTGWSGSADYETPYYRYFYVGHMVADSASNYGNYTFTGRMGGFEDAVMATYQINLMNRSTNKNGNTIFSTVSAYGNVEEALKRCDMLVLKNDDKSHDVYLKVYSWYAFNFNWETWQHSIGYTGEMLESIDESKVLWRLSTAPKTILDKDGKFSASEGVDSLSIFDNSTNTYKKYKLRMTSDTNDTGLEGYITFIV